MDAASDSESARTAEESRAARLAQRRTWRRRTAIIGTAAVVIAGGGVVAVVLANNEATSGVARVNGDLAAAVTTVAKPTTTTTVPPTSTTTTTVPQLEQPHDFPMPSPGYGLRQGSRGPIVAVYELRMKALHLDPGPIDGVFDQRTQYAVSTVQKYAGLPRTGVIDAGVQAALTHFVYRPAEPNTEPDRVEIDLDKQVLTLYLKGQPALLTTTSTGSGEHFCGGVDGCQYAITPAGHFHFYELHRGWQKGKLGTMWNPYYFNGSDAVHGLASVPNYPASHGCARIPMFIADYFYTLVHQGMSVFVVGTPQHAGNGYVGPAPTAAPPTTAPTTIPVITVPTPSTAPKSTTTPTTHPLTTTTPTTHPHTTTTT